MLLTTVPYVPRDRHARDQLQLPGDHFIELVDKLMTWLNEHKETVFL